MGRKRGSRAFEPESDFAPGGGPSRGAGKGALPSKPCLHCGRPMEWRRKWAKHWDEVRYCSKRCAAEAKAARAAERRVGATEGE